jgi:hypothetical protein
MINRREAIAAAATLGAFLSTPAVACKSPAPKDRKGYTHAVDDLLTAWWARDFDRFLKPFRHPERDEALPDRTLFDAHYSEHAIRFRGGLLFNGASVVVQVITPQQPDFQEGVCGGYAKSDLMLVRFYPGAETHVVRSVQFLDTDLLAEAEWKRLPGAPNVKIQPYWRLDLKTK